MTTEHYEKLWGIDPSVKSEGGLTTPQHDNPRREIWLLQRKPKSKRMGSGPGKTTGWSHKILLERHGVQMLGDVEYVKVDDAGLHIRHDGMIKILPVDNVILCAGQESVRDLLPVDTKGEISDRRYHVIGGADVASELDAKRAIQQGISLASRI